MSAAELERLLVVVGLAWVGLVLILALFALVAALASFGRAVQVVAPVATCGCPAR